MISLSLQSSSLSSLQSVCVVPLSSKTILFLVFSRMLSSIITENRCFVYKSFVVLVRDINKGFYYCQEIKYQDKNHIFHY